MQVPRMEETPQEIQRDSTKTLDVTKRAKTTPPNEGPTKKASIFCFKRRKKPCKEGINKDEDQASELQNYKSTSQHASAVLNNEVEELKLSWAPGGAWLAFKRLVTLRRRSKCVLKKEDQLDSQVHVETSIKDSNPPYLPKGQASSGLKIPCLRFSRSKKKPLHAELREELDQGEKTNETTSLLNYKSTHEPRNIAVDNPVSSAQSDSEAPETEGDHGVEITYGEVIISTRDNTLAVEMKPGTDQYTDCLIQSEIIHSETVLETEQEKQIFQLHHGSLYGNAEEGENKKLDFRVEMGPFIHQDLLEDKSEVFDTQETDHRHSQDVELGTSEGNINVGGENVGAGESHSVEVLLHCSPSMLADDAFVVPNSFAEEPKPEENKLPHGAGIVIMITEAEDSYEEEEPSPAYEPFSFSYCSKNKANKKPSKDPWAESAGRKREGKPGCQVPLPSGAAGDQDGQSPEQHEILLIETAASLVKAAIQSSVEQLVNEMALEQNKQNSFL